MRFFDRTLSDSLRIELREAIRRLEEAGVLRSDEVSIDDAIDCAELDDNSNIGFHEAMHILKTLGARRQIPFQHLAFFPAQVETNEESIVDMVREIARLAGQSDSLCGVAVTSLDDGPIVYAHANDFPTPNAKAEFDLAGRLYVVPFVMFGKNLPIGLFDELAKIFIHKTPTKRFVSAYCDLLVIAIVDNENVPVLERYFPDEFEPYASA